MNEFNREVESLQVTAVSLEQAERDLMAASKALDRFAGFEHVSTALLRVFKDACDRRDQAAARGVDRDED